MKLDIHNNKSHFRDTLLPEQTDKIDLGTAENRWRAISARDATFASTVTSGNLTLSGQLLISSHGPHVIGELNPFQVFSDPDPNVMFWIRGDFTPGSGESVGLKVSPAIRPAAGDQSVGAEIRPSFVEAASGTHLFFAALEIEPEVIAGTANVTDYYGILVTQLSANATTTRATGLKIIGPTGAASNRGLWISGDCSNVIDGSITLTDGATGVVGPSIFANGNLLNFAGGTSGYRWYNNSTANERMRLTDAGIFLVGTTVTSAATGGDAVIPNNRFLRGVNAAGTNAFQLIGFDTNNLLHIGGDSSTVVVGIPGSTASASAGDIVFPNNRSLRASNAGSTGTVKLLFLDTSDRLSMDANSAAVVVVNASTQTTIGANGAASALTANPVGYIKMNIGGSDRIIPYYNP
jgi:hypothetical protein